MKTRYTTLRYGILLLLVASLAGCFSMNKPGRVEHYSLPDSSAAAPTATAAQTLLLHPVQLADFLDSDRIMLQMDDIRLQPTRDHLWADALSNQLDRALSARLGKRLPATRIVLPPSPSTPNAMQLRVRIDQFQGHMNGHAITSGQWQLSFTNGGTTLTQPFKFETALHENGYPALVQALGQNVDQLAAQISEAISAQPQAGAAANR